MTEILLKVTLNTHKPTLNKITIHEKLKTVIIYDEEIIIKLKLPLFFLS